MVLFVSLLVVAGFGYLLGLRAAPVSALVAAATLGAASLLGSISVSLLPANQGSLPLARMGIEMVTRMAISLGVCLGIQLNGGDLARSGTPLYIAGFYLIALSVTTVQETAKLQTVTRYDPSLSPSESVNTPGDPAVHG